MSKQKTNLSGTVRRYSHLPTHDDYRTILRHELKNLVTKKDIERLERKIDGMVKTIVAVIEKAITN